jgi:glutaredoxin 3
MGTVKRATLYRMVLPDHVCPYGERAKGMLEEHGYAVDDCLLTSREDVDSFKAEHGLATTPMIVIAGEPILGSAELAAFLRDEAEGAIPGKAGAFSW